MTPDHFYRFWSHIWPIKIEELEGALGPLEIRWENGRKVVNSKYGNQSFGSLHQVWQQSFKALDIKAKPIRSVLLLGLGGGSVVEILRKELVMSVRITAVELDPVMISIAQKLLGSQLFDELTVIQGDAMIQTHAIRERFDMVVVDLFQELDLARGLDTNGFAHSLRDRCAEKGLVCVNTVAHNDASDKQCERVFQNLKKVFGNVTEHRSMGINRVFVAS